MTLKSIKLILESKGIRVPKKFFIRGTGNNSLIRKNRIKWNRGKIESVGMRNEFICL